MSTLGFAMVTFAPIGFREMGDVARKAEELGYDRCYTSESLTDSLAIDMWIVSQTERIVVAPSVSLIYYRHPLITAQAATTISDVSGGRFILGLGLGHEPRNHAMGVGFGKPLGDMREYVTQVRDILDGKPVYPDLPLQTYEGRALEIRRPAKRVPIMMAAVGPKMIELAGELADGVSLYMQPLSRIGALRERLDAGAQRSGRSGGDIELNLMVHTLVHDDIEVARAKARGALTYWVGLPSYNGSIRDAGFVDEAAKIRAAFLRGDQAAMRDGLSDDLLDEFCILGPAERCREQLDAVRAAGVDVPILTPDPVVPGESYQEALERTLAALAPNG